MDSLVYDHKRLISSYKSLIVTFYFYRLAYRLKKSKKSKKFHKKFTKFEKFDKKFTKFDFLAVVGVFALIVSLVWYFIYLISNNKFI